jgi:hypothetical protein
MRIVLLVLILVSIPVVGSTQPRRLPDGYLSTRGSQIVAANGDPVRMRRWAGVGQIRSKMCRMAWIG